MKYLMMILLPISLSGCTKQSVTKELEKKGYLISSFESAGFKQYKTIIQVIDTQGNMQDEVSFISKSDVSYNEMYDDANTLVLHGPGGLFFYYFEENKVKKIDDRTTLSFHMVDKDNYIYIKSTDINELILVQNGVSKSIATLDYYVGSIFMHGDRIYVMNINSGEVEDYFYDIFDFKGNLVERVKVREDGKFELLNGEFVILAQTEVVYPLLDKTIDLSYEMSNTFAYAVNTKGDLKTFDSGIDDETCLYYNHDTKEEIEFGNCYRFSEHGDNIIYINTVDGIIKFNMENLETTKVIEEYKELSGHEVFEYTLD
ncbi:MAG: hypothetical protein ACK5KQ_00315 [Anaerorhabdus sp.]